MEQLEYLYKQLREEKDYYNKFWNKLDYIQKSINLKTHEVFYN